MSLVLHQAGSLKPEIRLAQAVSEFEATLTPEQKPAFQASRARAVRTAPTMSDVMRLTAEIDLKATSKHGRGRCFGPRMTNTLQAIQQFAALGDIIVGGGQNLIACGVWAAARMMLHVVAGYFTYLESLSLLFMAIGRNAPRYQTMASLYPKSKSLQRYLCEYFIVITKLCHQSVIWTRKPVLSRLSSTISDPQIKTFKDDLDMWSSAIKEEVNVLLNQMVVGEAKLNSLFRSFATSRSDTSAHQRKIERQVRFLDACSRYDYRVTWKQKRKCGTTRITRTCHGYQQWKAASGATGILFRGKLGAGKSVLLANIVDDLNLQNNATTLYFFSRYDSEESTRARTIFGCLLRQLLEHLMDDAEFNHLFPNTISPLDVDDLVALFRVARPRDRPVFIVLDGLTECEMEVQEMVLQHLSDIQAFGYKICLSMRTSEEAPTWYNRSFHYRVFISETNPDISDFVNAEVDSRVRDGRLVTHDPNLVEEVKQELIAGACGMFLWVSLQLDSICAGVSDHDIREALRNLPRDLTETFQRNLAKATLRDTKKHHVRLFKLLSSAKELLTTEQLRQAASVMIGQAVWSSDKEINCIYPVLKFCGSLVMVDEEDETVRFIHHSARSFCIRGSHRVTDWAFSELEADQLMAEILVTYLNCSVFETRVSSTVVPTMDAQEMPRKVAMTAIDPYSIGTSIANRLLRSKLSLKRNIGPTLAHASMKRSEAGESFPLLSYAHKYWLRHTAHLHDLPSVPYWHSLLEHPSFGIAHEDAYLQLVDVKSIRGEMERRLKATTELSGDRQRQIPTNLILDLVSLQYYHTIAPLFSEYRNICWALSNGHILILRHELTHSRGVRRIRNYSKLWSILRHIALFQPSFIQKDLDYDLVRWLSPMFVNLAMDHPAKQYLVGRVMVSDVTYKELVKKAMEQADTVTVCALVRDERISHSNFSLLRWQPLDRTTDHRAAVPPILKAALSKPNKSNEIKTIMYQNDLWLFDLATWLFRMDLTYYHMGTEKNGPLSFARAFESLQAAGVTWRDIELLQSILHVTHDRLSSTLILTGSEGRTSMHLG